MKNKVIRLALSMLCSFVLWFIVISVEYTETERKISNIPIKTYGTLADGYQILSDTDDIFVDVTLTGNRFTLNKLDKSDLIVWVNLSKISSIGEKSLSYEVEFLNGIQDVAVAKQEPSEIKLTVAQRLEKDIPVKLDIINQDKMPQGFRVDMENTKLEHADMPIEMIRVTGPKELLDQIGMAKIVVDMEGVTEDVRDRKQVVLCDADWNRLDLQGMKHVTVGPSNLSFVVPVLMDKEIPIEFSPTNVDQMPEDYIIDLPNVRLENGGSAIDTILVSGPKKLVEQIAMAKVVVDMTDKAEDVIQSKKPTLCNAAGNPLLGDLSEVLMEPGAVDVTVPVMSVVSEKEVSVVMPTPLKGGGLTSKDVTITVEFQKLTVKGSPSALKDLDSITLPVIKLSEEPDSFVDRVYIVALPEGVYTVEGEKEVRVKVSLTMPPMETKSLDIPTYKVEMLNLPEGVLANIMESQLKVWVRGRGTILSQIRETDIKVSMDLSGATQSGYGYYPVTVSIKNYDNVGVITNPSDSSHTYQLYVMIVFSADIA